MDVVILNGSGWDAREIGPGTAMPRVSNRLGIHLHHGGLRASMATTCDEGLLRVGLAEGSGPEGWTVAAGERDVDGGVPQVLFLSLHRGDTGISVTALPVGDRSWVAEARGVQIDAVVASSEHGAVGKLVRQPHAAGA